MIIFIFVSFLLSTFGFGIMLSTWIIARAAWQIFPAPTEEAICCAILWAFWTWLVTLILIVVLDFMEILIGFSMESFAILLGTSIVASVAGACFYYVIDCKQPESSE